MSFILSIFRDWTISESELWLEVRGQAGTLSGCPAESVLHGSLSAAAAFHLLLKPDLSASHPLMFEMKSLQVYELNSEVASVTFYQ